MGLGHNAQAMLITRGLAETTRLGIAMGADPFTFAGLAGLGDLVATSSSPLSRNRTFGTHLGKGLSVEEAAAATRQTTEGVKSAEAILALARAHDVEMPITHVISALLHGHAKKVVPVRAKCCCLRRTGMSARQTAAGRQPAAILTAGEGPISVRWPR
jgi:glycerol-3-phosphate dehydrogenase